MTLDLGVAGTSYVVEALNLPPKVEILQIKTHGAMIVKVRGTRFALGKRISSNIHVISGE